MKSIITIIGLVYNSQSQAFIQFVLKKQYFFSLCAIGNLHIWHLNNEGRFTGYIRMFLSLIIADLSFRLLNSQY